MTTNARRGKDAERRLAKLVGGRRNPNVGAAAADVETDVFAFELKSRRTWPEWLVKAMGQARSAGARTGKTPIVVLEHRVQGHGQRLYCFLESDWLDWHGGRDGS